MALSPPLRSSERSANAVFHRSLVEVLDNLSDVVVHEFVSMLYLGYKVLVVHVLHLFQFGYITDPVVRHVEIVQLLKIDAPLAEF
jgi:hypothetical protein